MHGKDQRRPDQNRQFVQLVKHSIHVSSNISYFILITQTQDFEFYNNK